LDRRGKRCQNVGIEKVGVGTRLEMNLSLCADRH
jgi:hypothetical protein